MKWNVFQERSQKRRTYALETCRLSVRGIADRRNAPKKRLRKAAFWYAICVKSFMDIVHPSVENRCVTFHHAPCTGTPHDVRRGWTNTILGDILKDACESTGVIFSFWERDTTLEFDQHSICAMHTYTAKPSSNHCGERCALLATAYSCDSSGTLDEPVKMIS